MLTLNPLLTNPLIQVRDMSGDGSVIKRRLRLGNGEFPVDCPIEDTTVRVHYRLKRLVLAEGQTVQDASSSCRSGEESGHGGLEKDGEWDFDSRENNGGAPVEFDTGTRHLVHPLSRSISVKESKVRFLQRKYAYRHVAP